MSSDILSYLTALSRLKLLGLTQIVGPQIVVPTVLKFADA